MSPCRCRPARADLLDADLLDVDLTYARPTTFSAGQSLTSRSFVRVENSLNIGSEIELADDSLRCSPEHLIELALENFFGSSAVEVSGPCLKRCAAT